MKKNTLQKAVATALVGAMAVSTLAGCNKSANSDSTTAGTTTQRQLHPQAATQRQLLRQLRTTASQ